MRFKMVLLNVLVTYLQFSLEIWGSNASASNGTSTKEENFQAKERKGVCISQNGRFPSFDLAGNYPKSVGRKGRVEEFPFCRIYKSKTCCGRAQAEMAFVSVRRMIIGGEGSEECVSRWEALECAMCHPKVGTQRGPPAVCESFCDKVFDSCRDAFFAAEAQSQSMVPCGPRDTLCSRANQWALNGSHFCQLSGFRVIRDFHEPAGVFESTSENLFCFNGDPKSTGLDFGLKGKSERSGRKSGWLQKGIDWLAAKWQHMTGSSGEMGDNVSWLTFGLVLTAAAALLRWRRYRNRRNRAALLASKGIKEVRGRQQQQYSRSSSALNRKK